MKVILLQFPTPYRLQQEADDENDDTASSGCNLKLPTGPHDDAFMANPNILQLMAKVLEQSSSNKQPSYLLLQSNCEDVALHISNVLQYIGLEPTLAQKPRTLESLVSTVSTTRTKTWLKEQGQVGDNFVQRAAGPDWSSIPYLPVSTETEAACIHQGTPIHRCLYSTKPTPPATC